MRLQAPKFWFTSHKGFFAFLLWPLTFLYRVARAVHQYVQMRKIPLHGIPRPVVCVGNSVVGGAGKTPLVTYLAQLLDKQNIPFALISRGYGGYLRDATRVNPERHMNSDVGDEPLLLAHVGPTWVGVNRNASCLAAVRDGAEVLLLDDGLQNASVPRDFSLLVVDGQQGFGNGLTLPAGPLRETISESIRKIDAVVIIGDDKHKSRELTEHIQKHVHHEFPIFKGFLNPVEDSLLRMKGRKLFAFAGIGYPEKFFSLLQKNGGDVVAQEKYPDHYAYTMKDIDHLLFLASKHHATLITTLKDWVRLPPHIQQKVLYFEVTFKPNDPAFFNRFVMGRIETLMMA
ncbi:MAG: tetraacyldisaccharide 4'-kinase [Alphaproteobacteria bacterium]|nr:MAG: tetraacyldisaccharide 4'-kinase [Alphaproteobacteria bacterium]